MTRPPHCPNRWRIALMGTLLQLCLGTVYAWSFFQDKLKAVYGWNDTQVAWTFSLAIGFLGFAAACGGTILPRVGPRRLAVAGAVMFGAGYLLAAVALHQRWLTLLYLGYGAIGGVGLGLGYVTPVATVAKWFPDKKGLVTGMVIMGFGFGALVMSKLLAPLLFAWTGDDPAMVFAALGAVFLVVASLAGWQLQNPPEGYSPPGHADAEKREGEVEGEAACASEGDSPIFAERKSGQSPAERKLGQSPVPLRFALMWIMFLCNILAGIAIIGFQAPLFKDLWRSIEPSLPAAALAGYGASLIAVSSLFNGVGRMFWGGLSDRVGRLGVFRIMLASQVIAFLLLTQVRNPWLFAALICYVLLCYGGGFGTMPSLVLDVFGPRRMAVIYGAMLTAWSAGGVIGPQVVAWLKDNVPQQAAVWSFSFGAAALFIGLAITIPLGWLVGRKC